MHALSRLLIIAVLLYSPCALRAYTTLVVPTPAAFRADILAAHNAQYTIDDHLAHGLAVNTDLISQNSFKSHAIARTLFEPDLVHLNEREVIRISGSAAEQRCAHDWLGDYFGLKLPVTTNFSFEPWVTDILLTFDIAYRFACNPEWAIRFFAPLVATWWDLGSIEHNIQPAQCNSSYPAGYFADVFTPVSQLDEAANIIGVPCVSLLCTARQFFSQMLTPDLSTPNGSTSFAPLTFSRFAQDAKGRTGLADIYTTVGKTILNGHKGYLDLMAALLVPTSRYTDPAYLFGPMLGSGGHWGLGAACDAEAYIWQHQDDCMWTLASFYASVVHLFDTNSCRTLDLCGKPHSRYMTALQLNATDQTTGTTQPVFSGRFTPLAQLSTVEVTTSNTIQVNAAVLATLAHHRQRYSIGYDVYLRSCESIQLADQEYRLQEENWALKGNAFVYGFTPSTVDPNATTPNTPVALSVSQSMATIQNGTNSGDASVNNDFAFNDGIDSPSPAQFGTIALTRQPLQMGATGTQQFSSSPAILLSPENLDVNSARTRGFQQGILAQWAYLFESPARTGSIRIGTRIVFGMNPDMHSSPYNCCPNTCLNTWSLWIGGGIAL